jgi:hypothetical protein
MAIAAAIGVPIVIFVVRELAARPAETAMRLGTLEAGLEATRNLEKATRIRSRTGSGLAGAAHESAAEGFDEAVRLISDFRSSWGWTLASRAAGKELVVWRDQSARAWFAAAEAYERVARFDDAHRIYLKLSRSRGIPPKIADEAQMSVKRLEKQGLVSGVRGGT